MINENTSDTNQAQALNKTDVSICACARTKGKEGEKGYWCVDCGKKVMDVEHRFCGDCKHFRKDFLGSICTKHSMAVIKSMNVTFKVSKGTCFEHSH